MEGAFTKKWGVKALKDGHHQRVGDCHIAALSKFHAPGKDDRVFWD
jgi:hypothetical protein